MHEPVRNYLEAKIKQYGLNHPTFKVIDIGSHDDGLGGPSPKTFFGGAYWGVDIVSGKGVDQLISEDAQLHFYNEHINYYDVALLMEVLEHDKRPHVTMYYANMALRKGGTLIIAAGTGRYRTFTKEGLKVLLHDNDFLLLDSKEEAGYTMLTSRKEK